MLNWVEYEKSFITSISGSEALKFFSCSTQLNMKFQNAYKYKNNKKFSILLDHVSKECYFPAQEKIMLHGIEHEKRFITSGPGTNTIDSCILIVIWQRK